MQPQESKTDEAAPTATLNALFFDDSAHYTASFDWCVKARKEIEEMKKKPKKPKSFRKVTDVMDRTTLMASRKPGIRERMCVVEHTGYSSDVKERFYGYLVMATIENARVCVLREALNAHASSGTVFHLLDEELLSKEPPVKRFDVAPYLDVHIKNLFKNAPGNKMVHGLVAARFQTMPPPTVKTYDELIAWIETRGVPPVTASRSTTPLAGPRPLAGDAVIDIRVTRDVVLSGSARYYQRQEQTGRVVLTADQVMNEVSRFDSLFRAMEHLESLIEDTRPTDTQLVGEPSNATYEDHTTNGEPEVDSDEPVDFSNSELRNQLRRIVLAHNPELARMWGL